MKLFCGTGGTSTDDNLIDYVPPYYATPYNAMLRHTVLCYAISFVLILKKGVLYDWHAFNNTLYT